MALATYSSFVAVLVVPVQLLALIARPAALRRLASAVIALAVCCVPLAILAIRRGSGQLFWVPRPSRKVESQVLQSLTSTGLQPSFHPQFTTAVGLVASVLVLLALAVAVVRARRARRGGDPVVAGDPAVGGDPVVGGDPAVAGDPAVGGGPVVAGDPVVGGDPVVTRDPVVGGDPVIAGDPAVAGDPGAAADTLTGWPVALTLAWIAVPVVLTFVYSLVAQPIFLPRNLLICLPAVALALAVALTHPRLPGALAAAGLVAALTVRAVPLVAAYGVSPEPWRAVTAEVLARAQPGDCIAFYPEDGRNAFQYYVGSAGSRAPRSILPVLRWGIVKPFVERYATLTPSRLSAASVGCRRLWFVSSHEGQKDGPARSLANRAGYLRLDARLERAFGKGAITQYGYASPIHVQLLPGAGRRRPLRR
jgi:hypothetical protein